MQILAGPSGVFQIAIINAGIVCVMAKLKYHGAKLTREWFEQAGVKLEVINNETADYAKK
jgi:deoxycytidylate deaminase